MRQKTVIQRMVCILLLGCIVSVSMVAYEPDNGSLLPDSFNFDARNFYVVVEPKFNLPMAFFSEGWKFWSGIGGGLNLAGGYNWDGYLFGAKLGYTGFGNASYDNNLMVNFHTIALGLNVSKILSKDILPFLPMTIGLRPELGGGFNLLINNYYPSLAYQKIEKSEQKIGFSAYAEVGIYVDFFFWRDYVIPYAGYQQVFMFDKGGAVGSGAVVIGARAYPVGIGPRPQGLNVTTNPELFSPDGDKNNDTLTIKLDINLDPKLENWEIQILDPRNTVFKTFTGKEGSKKLNWNGIGDDGSLVQSANDYKLLVRATDKAGNVYTHEGIISIDVLIIDDGVNKKILVNSLMFDPNKATFDTLTKEQLTSNNDTLDLVANALIKYQDYRVDVQGYSYNISKTEEENQKELIPLSKARADSIKSELVKRGIATNRLTTTGKGGANSLANDSSEAWKDRRVEFVLIK